MQVVRGGLAAFDGFAFGLPSQEAISYFQSQVSNVTNVIGQYADTFKQAVTDTFNRFTNSEVLNAARLALHHSSANEFRDVIRPLVTIEDFQTAQPQMQRWIMANPVVREQYNKQTCDGYSGVYVDDFPNTVGEKHYDYRRVMDGVIQVDDEGNDKVIFYAEDLAPGDKNLTHHDKRPILKSWSIVERMFREGHEDPTNASGGYL